MSDILILVPARFGSTRFPGKPLALINGKAMIEYVVANCRQSGLDFAIVTDDDRIEQKLKEIDAPVVRVNDDVSTGSERIALAYQRHFKHKNYQFIINVQGDEPLLTSQAIKQLADFHRNRSQYSIATMVKERNTSEEAYQNPNVVKCALSLSDGKCLYFSRSPIPFNNSSTQQMWHQHIGIYSYQVQALERFVTLPPSRLESVEKLEQLRALENQMSIGACLCDLNLIGVDTPEDIAKIEGVLGV